MKPDLQSCRSLLIFKQIQTCRNATCVVDFELFDVCSLKFKIFCHFGITNITFTYQAGDTNCNTDLQAYKDIRKIPEFNQNTVEIVVHKFRILFFIYFRIFFCFCGFLLTDNSKIQQNHQRSWKHLCCSLKNIEY